MDTIGPLVMSYVFEGSRHPWITRPRYRVGIRGDSGDRISFLSQSLNDRNLKEILLKQTPQRTTIRKEFPETWFFEK